MKYTKEKSVKSRNSYVIALLVVAIIGYFIFRYIAVTLWDTKPSHHHTTTGLNSISTEAMHFAKSFRDNTLYMRNASHPIFAQKLSKDEVLTSDVNPKHFGSNLASRTTIPPKKSLPRVLVSFGTRPEAIKMAPVVLACKRLGKKMETWVMSTGQHREMIEQVMENFNMIGIIHFNLDVMVHNQTLSSLSAKVLSETTNVLEKLQADAVVVQGDTTTAALVAMAAFYQKIPVVHVEAGLRTRNIYSPFPEEANRNMIGNLASLHFPATNWARNNLLGESKHPYQIVLTGNPVVDALYMTLNKPLSNMIKSIRLWVEQSGCAGRMLVLTAHRRENQGARLVEIITAMERILKKYSNVCIVYPVHPNPNVRSSVRQVVPDFTFARLQSPDTLSALKNGEALPVIPSSSPDDKFEEHFKRMLLIEPVTHDTLAELMNDSYFILTDSGGIQEESVSLGKPVLILRDETERPEVVKAGAAVLCGAVGSKIELEANKLLAPAPNAHYQRMSENAREKHIYGDGRAGEYIAREIESRLRVGFNNESVVPVVKYGAVHDSTCFVGPYSENFSRISKLLTDVSAPGFAFARYQSDEWRPARGKGKDNAESSRPGSADAQVRADLLESLRGHSGEQYFYGFSAPADDADGLLWLLQRMEQNCQFISYSNLWTNANYKLTQTLINDIMKIYKGKVVLVSDNKSITLLKGAGHLRTGTNQGQGWVSDAVPLVDNLVEQWAIPDIRARVKRDAEIAAARHTGAVFMVSGGSVAPIIISWMWAVNPNNKYVDFGAALDPLLHGTRAQFNQYGGTAPTELQDSAYRIRSHDASHASDMDEPKCDAIMIVTVWKRETLDRMLHMMSRQSVIKTHKLCVTIFQNAAHIDVQHIVSKWEAILHTTRAFSLYYINSILETGYYGRFAVPLTAAGAITAKYWGVFDDDVIYGSRYLENAFRVNDEGYFCTRNGRIVEPDGAEIIVNEKGWNKNLQTNSNEDADFDFGGHIWVGRMQWLRSIWQHPPPTLATSEDFWLSAVLKSHYGIGTRTARCPSHASGMGDIELCACSMKDAANHVSAVFGEGSSAVKLERNVTEMHVKRRVAMQLVLKTYGRNILLTSDVRERTKSLFTYTKTNSPEAFDVSGSIFESCLFWS